MNSPATARPQITGRIVLIAMVTFFLTVTAVNAVMTYYAISTFGGVEPDSYREGLAYNKRIADEAAQTELGWNVTLALDDATSVLSVALKDHDGSSLDGLHVSATIGRPATNLFDRAVELKAIGNGRYSVPIPSLTGGSWTINIAARKGNFPDAPIVYRSRTRVWKQS